MMWDMYGIRVKIAHDNPGPYVGVIITLPPISNQ